MAVAILVALLTRRQSRELELLKSDLAARDVARRLRDEENRNALTFLDSLLASTQGLKDELLVLIDMSEHGVDSEAILKALNESVASIRSAYSTSFSHLSDDEMKCAHDAKASAFRIVRVVEQTLNRESGTLPASSVAMLSALRMELTASQMCLRECRMARLYRPAT
jgi:hypothetical protein